MADRGHDLVVRGVLHIVKPAPPPAMTLTDNLAGGLGHCCGGLGRWVQVGPTSGSSVIVAASGWETPRLSGLAATAWRTCPGWGTTWAGALSASALRNPAGSGEHRFSPESPHQRRVRDRAHQGLPETGDKLTLHIQVVRQLN